MRQRTLLALLALALTAASALAQGTAQESGSILTAPPAKPQLDRRHVIYLHGAILERGERNPSNERFGTYQYDAILERLALPGFVVISEHRPSGTAVRPYAEKVVAQVRGLLEAGLPPECITVVGFSKGGAIAVTASALLAHRDVRFVFLAPCGPYLEHEGLDVSGQILSIYEESDEGAGSCAAVFAHAATPRQLRETMISTGRGHGAFWQPRDAWVSLVRDWIAPGDAVACPVGAALPSP
jgi:hypothetical protein